MFVWLKQDLFCLWFSTGRSGVLTHDQKAEAASFETILTKHLMGVDR